MAKDVGTIRNLIKKAEIEYAKAQGVIESIKKGWKEEYGTDDVKEIEKKLQEFRDEYQKSKDRLNSLTEKLQNSYDWDKLEEELDV